MVSLHDATCFESIYRPDRNWIARNLTCLFIGRTDHEFEHSITTNLPSTAPSASPLSGVNAFVGGFVDDGLSQIAQATYPNVALHGSFFSNVFDEASSATYYKQHHTAVRRIVEDKTP